MLCQNTLKIGFFIFKGLPVIYSMLRAIFIPDPTSSKGKNFIFPFFSYSVS